MIPMIEARETSPLGRWHPYPSKGLAVVYAIVMVGVGAFDYARIIPIAGNRLDLRQLIACYLVIILLPAVIPTISRFFRLDQGTIAGSLLQTIVFAIASFLVIAKLAELESQLIGSVIAGAVYLMVFALGQTIGVWPR
jgi:hypothetical protein